MLITVVYVILLIPLFFIYVCRYRIRHYNVVLSKYNLTAFLYLKMEKRNFRNYSNLKYIIIIINNHIHSSNYLLFNLKNVINACD